MYRGIDLKLTLASGNATQRIVGIPGCSISLFDAARD